MWYLLAKFHWNIDMNRDMKLNILHLWGYGYHGQLGLRDETLRDEPTLLPTTNIADTPEWTQVACGEDFTAALTKDGKLFTWGINSFGQLGHGDGKLFTWGRNLFGELGHGDNLDRFIPTKVSALDGHVITQISCGARHMAALTDKGEVLAWYVP